MHMQASIGSCVSLGDLRKERSREHRTVQQTALDQWARCAGWDFELRFRPKRCEGCEKGEPSRLRSRKEHDLISLAAHLIAHSTPEQARVHRVDRGLRTPRVFLGYAIAHFEYVGDS